MNAAEPLATTLIANGVEPGLAVRLAYYGHLVLEANRTTNLTAAREPAAFAEHILDALTLAGDVDGPLVDLGSGPGLPGIPLAIATGQPVTLVESVKKKALFLARALGELSLAGEAVGLRAERLAADPAFRERYSVATARAVATAPTVAELCVPFLAIGGRALLQRGVLGERERRAVTDAAPMLGAELVEERLLGGDRRILVLRKLSPTQARFPRRDGIPEKRPLCFT
ncbi:MAG: RsmG family class I SAM-dependent methyltransferase [Candidatus Velthaea sp.]